MAGRVGEIERAAQSHDLAHEALAGLHLRDVHRAGIQALGGEELHLA